MFNCTATEISGQLSWQIDGMTVTRYLHSDNDTFPHTLSPPPFQGVMALVSAFSATSKAFNATSLLLVEDIHVLNGSRIQCENSMAVSNEINITVASLMCELSTLLQLIG